MKNLLIKVANKTREGVALARDVQRAKRNTSMFHLLTNHVLVIEGVNVYLDDEVVLASTGARSHQPNAVAMSDGKIIINTAAHSLPPEILEALVLHELCHVKAQHRPNPVLYPMQSVLGFGYGLQIEYEADEYAISKGAKVVELLETLIEHLGNNRALRLRLKRAKDLTNAR